MKPCGTGRSAPSRRRPSSARQVEPRGRRAGSGREPVKPLVLVVEDEAPLVTLLRYNLEKEGFAVAEAADGEEALLRIAEQKPDAAFLDWRLPPLSRIESCRQ